MRFVPKLVQVNFSTGLAALGSPALVKGSGDKWTLRGWSTDGTTVLVEDDYCDAETYHSDSIVLLVEGKVSISSLPALSTFKTALDSKFTYVKGFDQSGGICTINCVQIADIAGDYVFCTGLAVFRNDVSVFPVEMKG